MKKSRKYDNIACGDIETTPIKDGAILFKLGGFYDGNITFHTYDESEYLDYLLKNVALYDAIYFHNGGRFDLLWLIDAIGRYCPNRLRGIVPVLQGSRIIILDTNDGGRFLDSFSLLPASLEKVSQAILGEGKTVGWEDDSTLVERCLGDCVLLYKCLKKFFNTIIELGGEPRPTIASTAFATWQALYGSRLSQYRTVGKIDLFPLERQAYAGGRVEIFKKEAQNYRIYDVNSMYPYVMKTCFMPVGQPRSRKYGLRQYLDKGMVGLATVTLNVPECYVSPVWHKREKDGRLIFPVGTVKGTFVLDELRYFEECGVTIDSVEQIVVYDREKIFEEYVDRFYNARLKAIAEGNEFLKLTYKLLLNSLYGKFAQGEDTENLIFGSPDDTERMTPYLSDENGYKGVPIWKSKETIHLHHIHPIISATVTANSRILLHKLIKQHEQDIIYCDTDSLHTFATYPTGEGLGQLKLESEVKSGYYLAPKVYEYEDTDGKHYLKAKGFRIPEKEIEKGKEYGYVQVRGLKGMLKGGEGFGGYMMKKTLKDEIAPKREYRGVDSVPIKM